MLTPSQTPNIPQNATKNNQIHPLFTKQSQKPQMSRLLRKLDSSEKWGEEGKGASCSQDGYQWSSSPEVNSKPKSFSPFPTHSTTNPTFNRSTSINSISNGNTLTNTNTPSSIRPLKSALYPVPNPVKSEVPERGTIGSRTTVPTPELKMGMKSDPSAPLAQSGFSPPIPTTSTTATPNSTYPPVPINPISTSTSTTTTTPMSNTATTSNSIDPKQAARDKRRAAMLAAMSSMSGTPSTAASGSGFGSASGFMASGISGSSSGSVNRFTQNGQNTQSGMNTQSGQSGQGMEAFPWESHQLRQTPKIQPTRTPSTSTAKGANADPTLNIRQKVILSPEQRHVLQMVVDEGRSVFFTGSAGTGKSVLLREIIKSLRIKWKSHTDAVAVTASTGIAACNIGGVTIHSFGGIGLGADTPEKLCQNIRKNKKALSRWTRTKVLIMDEVSMVDGELFDKLSRIGSILRKKPNKPFGDIQIVVTGDFFQLPPVTKHNKQPTFAFEAETWNETVTACVNLTKVFRQRDQTFVDMLNEMRFGRMSQQSIARFANLSREIFYNDGIEPTELFPRREDVERANQTRLSQLRGEVWQYLAMDGPGPPTDSRNKILANMMAADKIILKLNAQVMLIKNVDETLVNGSMGKVIGFVERHLYKEDTAGKWIGQPGEESDGEDSVNEDGAPKKKRKTSTGAKVNNMEKLPVVSFRIPGGGTRDVIVEKDTFKTELPNGEIQASRIQLPLILAWAMSIHKSQGQTLDRVKVDLGRVFEKGQAYVALSRATSLEGLQVTGFSPGKVMAHPKVTKWSQALVTYE